MSLKKYSKLLIPVFALFTVISLNLNCTEKEKIAMEKKSVNPELYNSSTGSTDTLKNSSTDPQPELAKVNLVFIGTYTSGSSKGIYVYKLDTATGALSFVCSSPQTSNPSYLALHPNKRWVYSVNENNSGTISAFNFDTVKNEITFINTVSSVGSGPCHISIDNTGKYVLAANYNSGSVTVCPINPDGSLGSSASSDQHSGTGPVAGRQDGPHAHMIIQAENNFIYNTDLGIDKIKIYSLDTTNGKLATTNNDASTLAGAGPRHIEFHPGKPWAYVICELDGTVEAYNIDTATGAMSRFQTISTLPVGITAAAASADIHITPDGKNLYASNRGSNNNIAMYSIDQISGELTLLGHQSAQGTTPRNFVIDPSGKFLLVACQGNSKVITFKIDSSTGLLISTGNQISIPNPVCLKFMEVHQATVTTGIRVITLFCHFL
jgi:6-phosphogluconolactonase